MYGVSADTGAKGLMETSLGSFKIHKEPFISILLQKFVTFSWRFQVYESWQKRCGTTAHSSNRQNLLKQVLRTDEYWQRLLKNILRKDKYCQKLLKKISRKINFCKSNWKTYWKKINIGKSYWKKYLEKINIDKGS